MLEYSTESLENWIAVSEFTAKYVDVLRFLECCRACPHYAMKWSCPPYDFEPIDLWEKFSTFLVFGTKISLGAASGSEWDIWEQGGEMRQVMAKEKGKLLSRALSLEKQYKDSLGLSAGSCDLCGKNCTRRFGSPCRHPEQMRRSIEALGGNVSAIAQDLLGTPMQWMKEGKLPDYFVLVCGLLMK